jgi:hypothetical protein
MLVAIGADFATLMSSRGSLVHLAVAVPSRGAAARDRTEH